MDVINHSNGEFGRSRDGVDRMVLGRHAAQSLEGFVACQEILKHFLGAW